MRGSFGALCVALGILAAGLGGYLLNAETVTVCETEWDYVTDIGAAFQGSKADMDIEYSPSSNITGWSDSAEQNRRQLSAVDFRESSRANNYLAYTQPTDISREQTVVSANSQHGAPPVNYAFDGTDSGEMPEWAGRNNSETGRTVAIIGGTTVTGAYAVPLQQLMQYEGLFPDDDPETADVPWDRIDCTLPSATYPIFAVGSVSYRAEGGIAKAYFDASAWSGDISVYRAERAAVIGGEAYPIQDVYLLFGESPGLSSVQISMAKFKGSSQVFIDPSYGFAPYTGTYYTTVENDISCDYSVSPSIVLSIPSTSYTNNGTIQVSCDQQGGSSYTPLGTFAVFFEGSRILIRFTSDGGAEMWAYGVSSASMRLDCSGGLWTVSSGGSAIGTFRGPSLYYGIKAEASGMFYNYSLAVYDDAEVSHTMTNQGSQLLVASMAYQIHGQIIEEHSFDSAWWCNGYDNASVSVAFSKPASGSGTATLVYVGSGGQFQLRVICASGMWSMEIAGESVDIGRWQAILVKIEGSSAVAYPLTAFTSFTSYENAISPAAKINLGFDIGVIRLVNAKDTGANIRMSVVSTTVRLEEGGLYLQDGALSLLAAFPDTSAASIMIGSAAAVGDSVTFTSGGHSVTLPVDASSLTITIGGDAYELNGITFRWYSSAGPSASVAGVTYAPAIYDSGKVLDSGKIWAETKRGEYIQVLEAPSDWTVTLDGVWAPAVFFYEGSNEAAESTQISDFTAGIFRWDKDTTIIFMMGVSIVGGIVGTHWGYTKGADWLVIFGAIGVCWVIL